MDHRDFKNWLYLAVADELDDDNMNVLAEHLHKCEECRADFDELKQTMSLVTASAVTPSDRLLLEARRGLQEALFNEPAMTSPLNGINQTVVSLEASGSGSFRLREWFSRLTGPRLAITGAAAAVVVGFFAGYVTFGRTDALVTMSRMNPFVNQDQQNATAMITNVRFIESDLQAGELEVQYDLVRPVRLRAAPADSRMQRVLSQALLNGQNDGVRLAAISAMGDVTPTSRENRVKGALIEAVMSDSNPGVRRQALIALSRFPFDNDIKNTCLFVLKNDTNPGMRVGCINMLAEATLAGDVPGNEIYDELEPVFDHDDVLRNRYSAFIQEVSDVE